MKFDAAIVGGLRGCHHSWDSVLGERWDLLPGDLSRDESPDSLIKTLRFKHKREFCLSVIMCYTTRSKGRYRNEKDYRGIHRFNLEQARMNADKQ